MKTSVIARMSVRSLRRTKLRSGLTTLGIVVGVAALVAMESIGSGAKMRLRSALESPDARMVYVWAESTIPGTSQPGPADRINILDYHAIRADVRNIAASSPRIFLPSVRVQAPGQSVEAIVEGLDVGGFEAASRRVTSGSTFSRTDVTRFSTVCVVSESLASLMLPDGSAQQRWLRINDIPFAVIGIVNDTPSTFGRRDFHVYVPFTTLVRRLDANVNFSIVTKAAGVDEVSPVQQSLTDLMEQRRGVRRVTFRTSNAIDAIRMYSDGSLTVASLLAAVGAIALVVGGIGIMNIMLVSVTERTREIGIRLALGSRSRDILLQILFEAATLSLLGGLAGVALGGIASKLVGNWNQWPTLVTLPSIAFALVFSVGVGIAFGYHPARRAALLQPADALMTPS